METAVIFGGSGLVGRRVARRLVESGMHVIIPTRRRERVKGDLIVLPNVDVVPCDPADSKSMASLVGRADHVFNLVGILHESGRHSFEDVHVEFVRRLTDTISQFDSVRRLVHLSALNAMTGAPSRYLRSKGKGEAFVTKLGRVRWTVIRPSVVFGRGDRFVGMFGRLLRISPMLAVPSPGAKFQPIWVDDLAEMAAGCLRRPASFDRALCAGGPEVLTLLEIVRLVADAGGTRRPLLPLGKGLSRMVAAGMEFAPLLPRMLTRDNVDSMSLPSVCEGGNDAQEIVSGRLRSLRDYLSEERARHPHTDNYYEYRHSARRG